MCRDGGPRKNDGDNENDREPDQPHGHLKELAALIEHELLDYLVRPQE